MSFHVPPPVWTLGAGLLQRALTRGRLRPSRPTAALALAIGAASAGLAAASAASMVRAGTTVDPVHPERAEALVTGGVNAISRNPMYVGMAGTLVAHAVWRRSALALVPVAGFVAVLNRTQIAGEERALAARFGAAYADYRARVPRWLGPARG